MLRKKKGVTNVLILRFSALGDVAMTAPVVRAYALDYPDTIFTMVSAPMLAPLFTGIPNLRFEAVNTKEYEGLPGLVRLFKRLLRLHPDQLLDLHQVLRTYVLCMLFWLSGVPIFAVKKGRRQKHQLTRASRKHLRPLPSMISRYEDVFIKAQFMPLQVDRASIIKKRYAQNDVYRIGIAPFAKHEPKAWSLQKMEGVVKQLSVSGKYELSLFGGGKNETDLLTDWASRYTYVHCIAGSCSFEEELTLIGQLDLFVSMDSANMHFASFMGVPVLSIWGGTHPYAGFYGWRQDPQNAIQIDLACRPCSVFGSKPCHRGDLLCLQNISIEEVTQKIDPFFTQ